MSNNRTLKVTLNQAREWYEKGGELKELALTLFNDEELRKKELPKTWEDCYNYLDRGEFIDSHSNINKYRLFINSYNNRNVLPVGMGKPMLALCQLLICREVYRNGWKPDFNAHNMYAIYNLKGIIVADTFISHSTILSFQTPEVRDMFLENFKDLIEEAKELI